MKTKIGLDAGHGLYTSGKQTPDGIKEWSINDKICDKIIALLADYDCEIIRTDNDEGNTDESLSYRLNKYLNAGVSVFISIHHNAFTGNWNSATGVEIYTDINATTADLRLADCIYGRLTNYTGLKGRGIKKENFTVINQNKIPAVLVEGGFMDSTNDYKIITSDAGQTAYAKAVAEGLIEFLGLKKKTTTTTSTEWYRVRKTWKDATSQIGAFKSLENAKKVCKQGYSVFDSKGNVVYTTNAPATKIIKVGSTVKVNKGAKTYSGSNLASFVYNRNHTVKEIKGERVVITYNGVVVAAVKLSDLTLVS